MHRFEKPALVEPEPIAWMGLDFLIEKGHRLACQATGFFFCILRIGVWAQGGDMVENVFPIFAAHGGDDDGASATNSEHGARVGDIGLAP